MVCMAYNRRVTMDPSEDGPLGMNMMTVTV